MKIHGHGKTQTICLVTLLTSMLIGTASASSTTKPVLSDIKLLKAVGAKILAQDENLKVGYAQLTDAQEKDLLIKSHEWGRCAGFEALPQSLVLSTGEHEQIFESLRYMDAQNKAFEKQQSLSSIKALGIPRRNDVATAVKMVNENNLESWVKWFSSYKTRFHKAPTANQHVEALKAKIQAMTRGARFPLQVDLIQHKSTKQYSIRVHVEGSTRPKEIVVLGAHMDSINQSWAEEAPGADDNASGSSNLLEALRILLTQAQPQRSVEFFWYAGEEGGLLGSAEIAKSYRDQKANVIGVLQLDMTLFPGSGEFVLGSMNDFTSAWLRAYLVELNKAYIGAKIVEDRCGYGCSDHASWHRQGYPALMPFEATFNQMNRNIHTARDMIDEKSNFRHSAMFSKIAVAFAMDLGNSTLSQPGGGIRR